MNKTLRRILKANTAKLLQAYQNGFNIACYQREQNGLNTMAQFALSIVPRHFRDDMTMCECLMFNTKVIQIAMGVVE